MWLVGKIVIVAWLLRALPTIASHHNEENNATVCHLPMALRREIDSYAPIVQNIIREATTGSFKGVTWDELALFVDTFGPRLTGTEALENSIDYVLNKSIADGLENVHGEPVPVPHWVRGKESATLIRPRHKDLALLGLGYSVGTPKEGITAQAIVVKSFEELDQRQNEVAGKIVVYNQEWVSYEVTSDYPYEGAKRASKYGAVAALIRSATPYSLYTPHALILGYEGNVTKIPGACITAEDAAFLGRVAGRGETIVINLKMDAQNLPMTQSRNIIADIRGSRAPEKVVVVSGHIDSWDVGEGAMDDGGGAFISWQALRLLKRLNYRPRRTVRMIMWTAEEMGFVGAEHYINAYKAQEGNLQFVMESDLGTFMPLGLEFTGTEQVRCILDRIMKLFAPMGKMGLRSPAIGPDIDAWIQSGVPGGTLWNQNDDLWIYHHTNADTMLVEDPKALDMGTALFAGVAYILADISVDLPRTK